MERLCRCDQLLRISEAKTEVMNSGTSSKSTRYYRSKIRNHWNESKSPTSLNLTDTARLCMRQIMTRHGLTAESEVVEILARYACVAMDEFPRMQQAAMSVVSKESPGDSSIPVECEEAVCKALGEHIRFLIAKGVSGPVDSKMDYIRRACPSLWDLIFGKTVSGARLQEDLPLMSKILAVSVSGLWDICQKQID